MRGANHLIFCRHWRREATQLHRDRSISLGGRASFAFAFGNDHLDGGDHMGKVIVVTSGKGGVGKTTSTAALGAALARAGNNVVVVDFDVGLRNLDLVMGAERRVVFDFVNVVQGA